MFVEDDLKVPSVNTNFGTGQGPAKARGGALGRAMKHGTMESFGWHIEGFGKNATSKGFLGGSGMLAKDFGKGGVWGASKGLAFRSLPLAFTGYFMYQGYKEEGVWGAAKEAAYGIGTSAAFHYIGGMVAGSGPLAAALAVPLVAAGGAYAIGQAGRAHAKSLRQMEMGQSDQMRNAVESAGAATMRQRSLQALNNTHLNSRMALGNEGFLMHRSFGG